MTGKEAIEYIHARERFGSVLGLERIAALCAALGDPQETLRFVHVAGTNGKGSTCAMLAGMLRSAGLKTGLYTSPFVLDFRERIQIDGQMIAPDDLGVCTAEVKAKAEELERAGMIPTEFEILTAVAFVYFARMRCDVVVLEVGMGGLYDATNVIRQPLVSVITSISLDHTAVLGDTVAEIARNKAGILKQGCPAAVYPQLYPEAEAVLRQTALQKRCDAVFADRNDAEILWSDRRGSAFVYKGQTYRTRLLGEHQVYNAITALEAGRLLIRQGLPLTQTDLENGIREASMPARVQIISEDPLILLDGGHNPDGVDALCRTLQTTFAGYRISAVIGMMADKDVDEAARMLAPLCTRMTAVSVRVPRRLPAEDLREKLLPYCADVTVCEDSREAFRQAKAALGEGELLLVCGSLYLAGEIEEILE